MSLAANVLGDSIPELICGNTIYNVAILSRTDVSQNSITELKTIPIPSHVPQDGNVAVVDFDLDGQLDVLVVIDGTPHDTEDTSFIYAYNPLTNNLLFVHSKYSRTIGYPMLGDIDGDGFLEFMYLDYQNQLSHSRITAMKYTPQTGLQTKWQASHTDASGQTSMTLFDFNQDGIMEIVYRDEQNLRIINGSGKSHKTGNDTISFYNLYTLGMTAGTWKEYPVVADVNNDGHAEIVVCGKMTTGLGWVGGQLVVVGGIHPWAPARPVWNQYMYNVTNVNKDLTAPVPLFNNATAFTDPTGVVRRPFNNFLQQATNLDQLGRPFIPLANVVTNNAEISIEDSNTLLSFQICNTGSQILMAPFYITYYVNTYHGVVMRTETVNSTLSPGNCIDIQTTFPNDELLNYTNIENIVISANDHGTGVAQNGDQQEECDTTDNFATLSPCIIRDTVTADICVYETYEDENFYIPETESETAGVHYYRKIIHLENCDSMIVLQLSVHPTYEIHFTETIHQGNDYDQHGIFLSESLLEDLSRIDTFITLQSAYGCDSTIYVTINIAVTEIAFYLPNAITPSRSDGLNDGFFIPERARNQISDFEIMIFNRWGEMVFYSTDKNFCWQGEYKGKTFYDNVYPYVIHYSNQFGKWFVTKGTITVL
jgi:gliding motility-associated-like protein